MKKGMAIWTFSKIVMLIFLFSTMATVTMFVNLLNERVAADSAQALIYQIHDSAQAIVNIDALSHTIIVPLPETVPEKDPATEGRVIGYSRPYTIRIEVTPKEQQAEKQNLMSLALGWGLFDETNNNPKYTVASGSIIDDTVTLNDEKGYVYFLQSTEYASMKMSETTAFDGTKNICLQACKGVGIDCEPDCD